MWADFKADHMAGIAILICSSIGVIANGTVVFWISRLPSMANAFGHLSRNQATADLLHASSFFFYFAPMLIFDIQSWKSEAVSSWFGHAQLIFYDACNASHLFVSINRVIAIFFPVLYNQMFSPKNVTMINAFCWSISILPSIWAYRIADCRFFYYDLLWTYTFTASTECTIIAWYYDFLKSLSTIIIIVCLDLVTFTKCRIHGTHLITALSDAKARSRKRDEINFVTQASLQGFIFILELVTFFVFPMFVEARAAKFAFTTIAWILVHAFDGVIAVYFNKEFSRMIRRTANVYDTNHPAAPNQTDHSSSTGHVSKKTKQSVYSTTAP